MRKPTVFTPEVCQKIGSLINAGYGTTAIAKEIGVGTGSLSRYMYKNNLVCKPNEEKKQIKNIYPPELIRDWDKLHNWYMQYKQRNKKENEK